MSFSCSAELIQNWIQFFLSLNSHEMFVITCASKIGRHVKICQIRVFWMFWTWIHGKGVTAGANTWTIGFFAPFFTPRPGTSSAYTDFIACNSIWTFFVGKTTTAPGFEPWSYCFFIIVRAFTAMISVTCATVLVTYSKNK